ncbi:MAG: Gfo/Idh/MocA family oxidoreductase [Rhizobiaceae bacterium]|nr:Gfo/Idh/MocA family oxidoreductase [Rhizobiaceae bacterium]MCV0407428.1 Gfo/Idh/MocA family oxidoreductase [Rhizobiaceae bacterium]
MTATDATIRIAIVGVGKIARDQHLPSIAGNPDFELSATVSRSGGVEGVDNYGSIDALLTARPDVTAIALCQPPQFRFEAAANAIRAGRHVLLEKPPGATVAEVETLVRVAKAHDVTLFATWHSRFAAGVEPARAWLRDRSIRRVKVTWKEDVRRWHPGQDWIWQPGGLGVFDPGINALSIVTAILPNDVHLVESVLEFPRGRDAPIAAQLSFEGEGGVSVTAEFDWRQAGPQTWDIEVQTDAGRLVLSKGGAEMSIDGRASVVDQDREYAGIYRRFADLVRQRAIDVDLAPLVHVADAFMLGRRKTVEPFED